MSVILGSERETERVCPAVDVILGAHAHSLTDYVCQAGFAKRPLRDPLLYAKEQNLPPLLPARNGGVQ